MSREFDVIVIGAGTAGLNARRQAFANGASSVLLVEDGPFGTTCARVGCMPSKLLIHPSHILHSATHAAEAGILADISINQEKLFERVRSERDRFAGFVVESTEAIPQEQRIQGTASFVDDHHIIVNGEKLKFNTVVIATGSYNWAPPIVAAIQASHPDRVLTNDTIFELKALPQSIAVFGMGVIGLELGQALHRLGVRVHFFDPFPTLGGLSDPRVREVTQQILSDELSIDWGQTANQLTVTDSGVEAIWSTNDGVTRTETFQYILSATGRRPNLHKLNLEATSLPLDKRGMPPIDYLTGQVGDLPFFFAGDVTGERPLLHEASDEGRQAGANAALYPKVQARIRRTMLGVTFTYPNIAVIGKRFSELQEGSFSIGEVDYSGQGRARVMQENKGILRIYGCRETGRLLGAEGIAPALEHMAHLLAWAIQGGFTVDQALSMPFYHPVTEEGIRTALQDLSKNLRLG